MKDLLPLGQSIELGSYHFTKESIVEFATQFDPHPFHLDEEEAKGSLFGGLCASGWHVCAAAMKCNVDHLGRLIAKTVRDGNEPPRLGPSPGIRNLRWLKPVFVEDTVTFSIEFRGERPVEHRPGRFLSDYAYSGVNQNGEPVMQFECSVVEFD